MYKNILRRIYFPSTVFAEGVDRCEFGGSDWERREKKQGKEKTQEDGILKNGNRKETVPHAMYLLFSLLLDM